MKVKAIRIDECLIDAWTRKYHKNGDARIRELMTLDLAED